MGEMVPKGPRAGEATVRDITSARSKGGRPSGLGYDPATEQEHQTGASRQPRADPETDVFNVVGQRGYSEDRFYTKSTNEHNHGAELRVRVPQGIDSQIHAAVSDVPEYRNAQDFWRDAAVHRLEYLQKRYSISEEGQRFLELERLTADRERRTRDIDTMDATVTDLGEKLERAWSRRDYGMLAKELEEGDELIDWLREPYHSEVRDLLAEWNRKARAKIMEYRASIED